MLITLAGGVIGVIGVIAESNILSENNIGAAIPMGVATLAGIGLSTGGLARYITLRRSVTKGGE